MKEDAQLICPISYEDPENIWNEIQKDIIERLPLRDVTWKHPVSSTFVTIPKLPLKFLPSSANLFKDTDHPFRWFLAPYVHVYITGVESIDAYKVVKGIIKQWMEYHNTKKSSWLVLYAPNHNNVSTDLQTKLNHRISSDFYMDRSGDRSLFMSRDPNLTSSSSSMMKFKQTSNNSINDILSKLREGVVYSFQQRVSSYDNDIRRLDSYRSTPQLEFRQLFLVKESLALMYQMHQLPNEALIQYEELQALLAFVPRGVLPDGDWPWIYASDAHNNKPPPPPSSSSMSSSMIAEGWIGCCRNGDDILSYSMNSARTKILKNKVSLSELHRYVFARQFYLCLQLNKPYGCCDKGYHFIINLRHMIDKNITVDDDNHDKMIHDDDHDHSMMMIRQQQADLWAISASVKICRACIDALKHVHDHQHDIISSTSSSAAAASEHHDMIWDDATLSCLSYISELLSYASSTLERLITDKDDNMMSSIIHAADMISCWDDMNDAMMTSYPFLSSSSPVSSSSSSSSSTTTTTTTSSSSSSSCMGVEEMLARVSRKLRHIALDHHHANGDKMIKKRTKPSSSSSSSMASSYDVSELLGSSPPASISSPWMEHMSIKPSSSLSSSSSYNHMTESTSSTSWQNMMRSNSIIDDADDDHNIIINNDDINIIDSNTSSPSLLYHHHHGLVELYMILSSIHAVMGRYRFAYHYMMHMADILLYGGNTPRALEYYSRAMMIITMHHHPHLIVPSSSSSSSSSSTSTSSYMIGNLSSMKSPIRSSYDSDETYHHVRDALMMISYVDDAQDWMNIIYDILKRMMLASRIIDDKRSYMMIAIEMIKPKYMTSSSSSSSSSSSKDKNTSLWQDIISISSSMKNRSDAGHDMISSYPIIADIHAYMKINASFVRKRQPSSSSSSSLPPPSSSSSPSSCISCCRLSFVDYPVSDVKVPLLRATHTISKHHHHSITNNDDDVKHDDKLDDDKLMMTIEVDSMLSYPIAVDDVRLIYRPLAHDVNRLQSMLHPVTPIEPNIASSSSSSSSYLHHINDDHLNDDDMMIAHIIKPSPSSSSGDDKMMYLYPGKQELCFNIIPSHIGEYALYEIHMMTGNIIMTGKLSSPMMVRDHLSSSYPSSLSSSSPSSSYDDDMISKLRKEVLCIRVDDNPLQTLSSTASLSPLGQVDIFELRLSTGPYDTVTSFTIDVMMTRPSSYSSSSSSSMMNLTFESPDHWQVIETGPTSSRRYKCPSSSTSSSSTSSSTSSSSSSRSRTSLLSSSSRMMMSGLTLRPSSSYVFKIPYLITSSSSSSSSSSYDDISSSSSIIMPMTCIIAGELSRGRCKVSISSSLQTAISCAMMIHVDASTSSYHLVSSNDDHDDEHSIIHIYRQYIIKNMCEVPIDLIAYRTSTIIDDDNMSSYGDISIIHDHHDDTNDDGMELAYLPESIDLSNDRSKLPSSLVSLLPYEEHHVCLHLIYRPSSSSYKDKMSIWQQYQAYVNAHHHASSSLSSLLVKFMYRRQSLELAYTGHNNNHGDSVMFIAKAPLIDASHDISSSSDMKPKLDIIASAMISYDQHDDHHDHVYVNHVIRVQYHINVSYHHIQAKININWNQSSSSSSSVRMYVSLANSMSWIAIGCTKQCYHITLPNHDSDDAVKISCIMDLSPVRIGCMRLPSLMIKYVYDGDDDDVGIMEMVAPMSNDAMVINGHEETSSSVEEKSPVSCMMQSRLIASEL